MEIIGAYLILADISGYTRFIKMHRVSLLHAEEIVTELMEAVIDAAGPPLKIFLPRGGSPILKELWKGCDFLPGVLAAAGGAPKHPLST